MLGAEELYASGGGSSVGGVSPHGHGAVQYTNTYSHSTTNLPGYENDDDPLIESKIGIGIQMTPMRSPSVGSGAAAWRV